MENTLKLNHQHHGKMQPGDRFASMSRLPAHAIACLGREQAGGWSAVIGHKRGRDGEWSNSIGQSLSDRTRL